MISSGQKNQRTVSIKIDYQRTVAVAPESCPLIDTDMPGPVFCLLWSLNNPAQ
jgi:hypothetical protein